MRLPPKAERLKPERLLSHAFGLPLCLIGVATALVLIGCVDAGPTTAGARQVSARAQSPDSSCGRFKPMGVPVAGKGYIAPIFSGNSRRFIALNEGAANENVRVWDVSTLQPVCEPLPQIGPDYGLTFDGKTAFTTDERTIRFWDADTSKLIRATMVTHGDLDHVAISPDGTQFLAIVKGEQRVQVWHTGEARPRLLIKQDAINVAFDPTGTRIAIDSGDATHIFSAETGKRVCPPIAHASLNSPHLPEPFDSTGRWFLVEEFDAFSVVDTTTGKTRFHVDIDGPWGGSNNAQFVRWSPDSSNIVAAALAYPQPARVYDAATGKLERRVGRNVVECWVGPDARYALGFCGRSFESLGVWDLKSGRQVQTLKVPDACVSPDCSTILGAPEDGLGAIWRIQRR